MGCVPRRELVTPFMHVHDSGSQSMQRNRLIWSVSDATSEGFHNFAVDIKSMAVADLSLNQIFSQVLYQRTTKYPTMPAVLSNTIQEAILAFRNFLMRQFDLVFL